MTHYLELSSGSEHKFYELTLDELTIHLRYGRIGTDGQRQTKTHPDADAAKRDAEKRLAEKRRKGYIDAVPGERLKQAITPARLRLPPLLKAHRERIEATLKPVVVLQRDPRPAALWHSKIGGVPYRPQGQAWPHTPDGRPLAFLAQVNFAELPVLDGYPTSGLLQVFILDDPMMGAEFWSGTSLDAGVQETFRVLWHEQVHTDVDSLDPWVPKRGWESLPHDPNVEVRVVGVLDEDVMPANDRLFDDVVGIDFLDETETRSGEILGDVRAEAYYELTPLLSKVGGYADFIQHDPRGVDDPHVVLLQLGSRDDLGLMWGDSGVGNILIRPEDLVRRDFSRVSYQWDCC